MINFSNTSIEKCITHFVGNKYININSHLSNEEIEIDENLENKLKSLLLANFKNVGSSYRFSHSIQLSMNEVFSCIDNIFEGEDFVLNSKNILTHLFEQTKHQSLKSGEVIIALFNDLNFENTFYKAIGIFKSESNSDFLKLFDNGNNIGVYFDSGKYRNNIDKACLILNHEYHEGFTVYSYEKNNADTTHWKDDFLSIIPKRDNYFHTTNLLNSFKEFVFTDLPENNEINKAEQIHLINKSLSFFKENINDFSTTKFIQETLDDKSTQKQFFKFKEEYEHENNLTIADNFSISNDALKKQLKVFKSVIKLDKNFHIYVHGKRELIEQGVDKDGRKYYKIYFENEF